MADPQENEPEVRKVNPAELRFGPIRRESLKPDQEAESRAIYNYLTPFLKMTFEEFEIGFLRDMHPEKEIAVWRWIQAAHEQFCEQCPDEDIGHDVLTCLLMISMGGEKPSGVSGDLWDAVKTFCETD